MTSLRAVVAEIIDLPEPDPDAPGPFRYAGAEKLVALLEGAGFHDVDKRDWRGRLALGGGLSPADVALQAFSVGELLGDAGEATLDEIRRALTAQLSRHEEDGAVCMDARVHIVTGVGSQAS
jgi:hypothetical protein